MRTPHRARLEQLEGAVRAAVQPGRIAPPALGGLTEAEVELYADLCARAREGTPEVQDRLGEVLGSPERLREVLRILAEVGAGEEWTLEGILGRARGLTVPEVLEREDGPAILGALADHVFAQLEGGDHADTPDPHGEPPGCAFRARRPPGRPECHPDGVCGVNRPGSALESVAGVLGRACRT